MPEVEIYPMLADITRLKADVIVNSANMTLGAGSGVCGAIHHRAGPELAAYCRTLGGCQRGQAKITPGFKLPAKYVVHTVGPVWEDGLHGEAELLASCYRESLKLASSVDAQTVAFPSISTGIYRYPFEEAARIAVQTVRAFLQEEKTSLLEIAFCCMKPEQAEVYSKIIKKS